VLGLTPLLSDADGVPILRETADDLRLSAARVQGHVLKARGKGHLEEFLFEFCFGGFADDASAAHFGCRWM
jgi:hypothetical protein